MAYRVGGIPDWLSAGESGELAPDDPPTVAGLADAIHRSLADPSHYARLSRGAFEIASRFTLDGAGNALVVVAGDFNIVPERSSALGAVAHLFSAPMLGSLDQVLVGGAPSATRVWAPEERAYGERLLSDHAPVEARF